MRLHSRTSCVSVGRLVVAKLHGQRIIVGVMRLAFIPIPNSAVHGCPGVWFPEKPDELVSDSGKHLAVTTSSNESSKSCPYLNFLRPFLGPLWSDPCLSEHVHAPSLNGWQPCHPLRQSNAIQQNRSDPRALASKRSASMQLLS